MIDADFERHAIDMAVAMLTIRVHDEPVGGPALRQLAELIGDGEVRDLIAAFGTLGTIAATLLDWFAEATGQEPAAVLDALAICLADDEGPDA